MSITLAQICDAIETTLGAATTLTATDGTHSQSYDELEEGIGDVPMLQVYPQSGSQDAAGRTDRTTFGGGNRQTEFVIHADYYARERSHIGEDMALLVNGIDAMQNVFEGQDKKPYFDLAGIQAFRWTWERVQFAYGGTSYMGARFMITVRVF